MFGSETLEVAIGVAVLFTFASLFATTARETIEACFKQRAKFVHDALAELFSGKGDKDKKSVLADFYENILISPQFSGAYTGRTRNLPSYIPSKDFASAVIDVARNRAGIEGALLKGETTEWIKKIDDKRLQELVRLAIETAGGDPEKTRAFLASWFDSQMERVSGWYKRSTHTILLAIGFGCAAFLNIDAVAVTEHLYRNDVLRELVVARAQASPPAALVSQTPTGDEKQASPAEQVSTQNEAAAANAGEDIMSNSGGSENAVENAVSNEIADQNETAPNTGKLAPQPAEILDELHGYGFPIGWAWSGDWPKPVPQCALHRTAKGCDLGVSGVLAMILGWVITMFAIALGAPFWFDLLNKFMVIRSTVKPFEKSKPEGSEDRQVQRPTAVIQVMAPTNAPAQSP